MSKKYVADNPFFLHDGNKFHSLHELLEQLKTMDDETFHHHVNEQKNDFSSWIRHSLGNDKLANRISKANTKKDIFNEIIAEFGINTKKGGSSMGTDTPNKLADINDLISQLELETDNITNTKNNDKGDDLDQITIPNEIETISKESAPKKGVLSKLFSRKNGTDKKDADIKPLSLDDIDIPKPIDSNSDLKPKKSINDLELDKPEDMIESADIPIPMSTLANKQENKDKGLFSRIFTKSTKEEEPKFDLDMQDLPKPEDFEFDHLDDINMSMPKDITLKNDVVEETSEELVSKLDGKEKNLDKNTKLERLPTIDDFSKSALKKTKEIVAKTAKHTVKKLKIGKKNILSRKNKSLSSETKNDLINMIKEDSEAQKNKMELLKKEKELYNKLSDIDKKKKELEDLEHNLRNLEKKIENEKEQSKKSNKTQNDFFDELEKKEQEISKKIDELEQKRSKLNLDKSAYKELEEKLKRDIQIHARDKDALAMLRRKHDLEVRERLKYLREIEDDFKDKSLDIQKRLKEVSALQMELEYKQNFLEDKENEFDEKENSLKDKESSIKIKDSNINKRMKHVEVKETEIEGKEKLLAIKEKELKEKENMLNERNNELSVKEDKLNKLKQDLEVREKEINLADNALDMAMDKYSKEKVDLEDEEFHEYLHKKLSQLSDHEDVMRKTHDTVGVNIPKYSNDMENLKSQIDQCKGVISNGDMNQAKKMYNQIRMDFYGLDLTQEEKTQLHNLIRSLYDDINLALLSH